MRQVIAWEDVKRGETGEVGESVGQIQYAIVEAVVGTKGAGLVVKGLSTGAKALIGVERLAALTAKISKFANALKQGVLKVVKVGRKEKYIEGIRKFSLNNTDARKWYLQKEADIPNLIDKNLSLEQQARQAFELRNKYRREARELMADRKLADELNANERNMTWEEIVQKTKNKGFEGDDIYEEIINSSQRSRKSVNDKLGLDPNKINGNE